MSNCYTNCCFAITVTAAEAALLREAIALADFIDGNPEEDELADYWNGLSEAFRTLFAPTGEEVISGFLAVFPDADFPTFGTSFSFDEHDDGTIRVFATAEQFEPDAVAELLHRIVTQSLPIRITWSYDSDRHRVDAFGGGGFLIDAAGVHWIATSMVHDKTYFAPKLVIAMYHEDEGLLFWNENDGFGSLDSARVYTEEQARDFGLPIADNQPEWLALPSSPTA